MPEDVKCLSEKKIKIAELLVQQRHPLCKIHPAEALPILKYLPAWLIKKNDDE